MNNLQHTNDLDLHTDVEYSGRVALLQRFDVAAIQHICQSDLLLAQSLAGHGDVWGRWMTPASISPNRMDNCYRDIDIARRLRDFLKNESAIETPNDSLVDEGVLVIVRLALITRLIPTGGRGHGKSMRLKPSTITQALYDSWPKITARAITRKSVMPDAAGLFVCLTESDVEEFNAYKQTRIELSRLDSIASREVWTDVPPRASVTNTTNPSGKLAKRTTEDSSIPFAPLPDEYVATIGPRVLWIVQQMGPYLLHLLEALPNSFHTIDWSHSETAISSGLRRSIAAHLARHPWRCVNSGRPLVPPFPLTTALQGRNSTVDTRAWPPTTWEHIIYLSMTLQAAHLFLTLFACAGRVGEVMTLSRDCIVVGRDGSDYLRGCTYKLSGNLFGDIRQWPAPDILRQCLGQQARLARAWGVMPRAFVLPKDPRFGESLWISLGVSGGSGKEGAELAVNTALRSLAVRIGMDPMPGGINLHAHRLRKTVARVAGVALFNSPLVLKRLFGHKSIEMTLHYILSDPSIREEVEKVLRELRIMHCAEALEEIHEALKYGQPLPGNGGQGAARLVTAVSNEEKRIDVVGGVWSEGSAYDLAYLITAQGKGWRLVKENVICSKAPGEHGMCRPSRSTGEPNTANCKQECANRIVLMRQRRDTELIIAQYLDIAREARDDGQLLVLAGVMENLKHEMGQFGDLSEKYLADHEVRALFSLCGEALANEKEAVIE